MPGLTLNALWLVQTNHMQFCAIQQGNNQVGFARVFEPKRFGLFFYPVPKYGLGLLPCRCPLEIPVAWVSHGLEQDFSG
jgi:hypothetical protein